MRQPAGEAAGHAAGVGQRGRTAGQSKLRKTDYRWLMPEHYSRQKPADIEGTKCPSPPDHRRLPAGTPSGMWWSRPCSPDVPRTHVEAVTCGLRQTRAWLAGASAAASAAPPPSPQSRSFAALPSARTRPTRRRPHRALPPARPCRVIVHAISNLATRHPRKLEGVSVSKPWAVPSARGSKPTRR